jgi:hypothetical protein
LRFWAVIAERRIDRDLEPGAPIDQGSESLELFDEETVSLRGSDDGPGAVFLKPTNLFRCRGRITLHLPGEFQQREGSIVAQVTDSPASYSRRYRSTS